MESKESYRVFTGPIDDLLSEVTAFLVDPDVDAGPGCEILVSKNIGGFHYLSNQLTHSLSKLLRAAVRETPPSEDIILTLTETDQQKVHLSVVSPFGGFDGISVDDMRQALNAQDDEQGEVKETPNTAFWRGGAPDEETDVRLEPVAFGGGTKATVIVPGNMVDWL